MSRRAVLILVATSAMLFLASAAVLAVTTTLRGGTINQVRVVREDVGQIDELSTTFVDIPGAATTVSVPRGEKGLILARFSAESACYGETAGSNCAVKIVVVNNATGQETEACPCEPGVTFAFDSSSSATDVESHSMDRSLVVPRGSYTVKAQWAVESSDTTFFLDAWSFTVEKARAS